MNKKNDLWNNCGKYAYHSYKNEEALPWVILGTLFCLVFITFAPLILFIWIWYVYYCWKNNKNLEKDPEIQKFRKEYNEYINNK